MNKDLIDKLCNLLGIKVDEEFCIENSNLRYKINYSNFYARYPDQKDGWYPASSILLKGILFGIHTIKNISWKPKYGESYFTFECNLDNIFIIVGIWENEVYDYSLLKNGWVFKTKEEALKVLPIVAKETGKIYNEKGEIQND